MDPLHLFLLDQGLPVEYELDEFIRRTQEQLYLTMSTAMQNSALTPSYFTSGQYFLETFTVLSETTRTTNSVTSTFLSSNSKHDFCYTMANISPSHIQQHALLSQLYHNFSSFPYFFPSSINSLFHAAIKNLHIKPNGNFLLLHLLLYFTTISEGMTHTQINTFLR